MAVGSADETLARIAASFICSNISDKNKTIAMEEIHTQGIVAGN
jgi:hypothetical protein